MNSPETTRPLSSAAAPLEPAIEPTGPTGPRTAEGKAASSRNASKHNLCARRLTGADLDEYNEILERYHHEWKPETETERHLIAQMALNQWRLDRAFALELDVFDRAELDAPARALVLRYRSSAERGFYKALHELQRVRAALAADRRIREKEECARQKEEEEERFRREIDRYVTESSGAPQFVSQNNVASPATPIAPAAATPSTPPPSASQQFVSQNTTPGAA